jgi:hypothetical protein
MPGEILIAITYKRTVQHVQYEPQDVGLALTFPLDQFTPGKVHEAVKAAVTAYKQLQEAGDGLLVDALATGRIARPEPGSGGEATIPRRQPVAVGGYQPTPGPVRPSVPPRKP